MFTPTIRPKDFYKDFDFSNNQTVYEKISTEDYIKAVVNQKVTELLDLKPKDKAEVIAEANMWLKMLEGLCDFPLKAFLIEKHEQLPQTTNIFDYQNQLSYVPVNKDAEKTYP